MQGQYRELHSPRTQLIHDSALAFLDKSLFTTFHYDAPTPSEASNPDSDNEADPPTFEISLTALLETLQIFGFADTKDRWSSRDAFYSSGINGTYARTGASLAFDNRVLGMTGICRFGYDAPGAPLCITLEEGNVTTTCQLTTFEAETHDDVPFARDHLAQKIIMRASLLHDAVAELAATGPDRLTIVASPVAPFFALSAIGPLGSATVEFANEPALLETFQVPRKVVNTYKFSLVQCAVRAMAAAAKVSIRGDDQGVLSLQFLIEVDDGSAAGAVSFVDFRFVPFVPEEGDEEGDEMPDEHDGGTDRE